MKYVIEDERHAEPVQHFATYEAAIAFLRELSATPWGTPPNVLPCGNPACHRTYELIEYDDTTMPHWTELRRSPALTISASGIEWAPGFAA